MNLMPPGRLPLKVFQACQTRRSQCRSKTFWRDYISLLNRERQISHINCEEWEAGVLLGRRMTEFPSWTLYIHNLTLLRQKKISGNTYSVWHRPSCLHVIVKLYNLYMNILNSTQWHKYISVGIWVILI